MKTDITDKDARVEDARVCHRMGWKFHKGELAFGKTAFIAHPKLLPSGNFSKSSFSELVNTPNRQISKTAIPPFISAPTFASDGIVLEWVQGQKGNSFQEKFNREMKRLANKAFLKLERYGQGFESGFELLVTQKPGMYARALLEVNDNE